jgi:hypothetical protein
MLEVRHLRLLILSQLVLTHLSTHTKMALLCKLIRIAAITLCHLSKRGRNQPHLQSIEYGNYFNYLFFIFDVSLLTFILF